MFRVVVFVDDKKLGDVLRALTGLVRDQPVVEPVENVEETENGVKAASNGSLLGIFTVHLNKLKATTLTPVEVQDWLEKIGKSRLSATYLTRLAIRAKLLRRTGNGHSTVYHIKRRG